MIITSKTEADFEHKATCPYCGRTMDTGQLSPMDSESATAIPEAGDLGVCVECAGLLVYVDDQGTARKMTPKDVHELDAETKGKLIDMQLTIKAARASGPEING